MLKVISKGCRERLGTWLKLLTKALSKSLWHDANPVKHTNSLLNTSDAKCPESATREVDIVSQITASISRMLTQHKYLSKTVGKNLFFQLVIYSNLLNSTRKKLEQQEGVHGYLSWWLGTSLWQCDRTQNCIRGDDTKTNQRLTVTRQNGLPVILCQFWNNLLWKQQLIKNVTVLWKL